jgi:hypothetical protein
VSGLVLAGFLEGPLLFAPTYKYIIDSDTYDLARIPAWCDRYGTGLDYVLLSVVFHFFFLLFFSSLPFITELYFELSSLMRRILWKEPMDRVGHVEQHTYNRGDGVLISGTLYWFWFFFFFVLRSSSLVLLFF